MKRQYFETGLVSNTMLSACITKTEKNISLKVTNYYGDIIFKGKFNTVKEAKEKLEIIKPNSWWTSKGYVCD